MRRRSTPESKQTAATSVFVGRVAPSPACIALVSDGKQVLASGDAGLHRLGKRGWIKLADGSIRGTDVHPMQTFKDSKSVTSFSDAA